MATMARNHSNVVYTRRRIVFGWYGGKFSHLKFDYLRPVLQQALEAQGQPVRCRAPVGTWPWPPWSDQVSCWPFPPPCIIADRKA